MSVKTVSAEGVLTIVIDRPQARNALDYATAVALSEALDAYSESDEFRCAILTGAGGYFCAGMDLKAIAAGGQRPFIGTHGFGGLTARALAKPLIAAVEGVALGGGCELALSCDLVLATVNTTFGFPEVRFGLVAGAGGMIRLPQRVGVGRALEMMLVGEPISGERAHEIGLVNRLVPEGSTLTHAQDIAQRIAENAPLAVSTTLQVARATEHMDYAQALEYQERFTGRIRASRDAREGALAFAEGRPPVWQGR